MAALTKPRNTPWQLLRGRVNVPMDAAKVCYEGGIVAVAAGYATPGATATGLTSYGIAEKTADNATGLAGAIGCEVLMCAGQFNNSGTDPVAQADVGATVYIEDDQTICKTASGKSAAGTLLFLDPENGKPWVYVGVK